MSRAASDPAPGVHDPASVADGLGTYDYLADEGLATAVFLALRLQRPLFLEGDAGVGKTEVAKALAAWTGGRLVRLQATRASTPPKHCSSGTTPVSSCISGRPRPPAGPPRRASRRWKTSCTTNGSWCGGPCCRRCTRRTAGRRPCC